MASLNQSWNDSDFSSLSWHDNYVYGFAFSGGDHGTGKLSFDIDFILEWAQSDEGRFKFLIAPADLVFQDVWQPKIELDYQSCAMGPFSIDGIRRNHTKEQNRTPTLWTMAVNFPRGQITFEASGFEQRLRKQPIWVYEQRLETEQRT